MKTPVKIVIFIALAAAVIAAVALKRNKQDAEPVAGASTPVAAQSASAGNVTAASNAAVAQAALSSSPAVAAKLPKLVDLGADKCIPCKMMAPILEELKKQYAGQLEVEFIDVWKNPAAGRAYGIQMIPTQIFYDAEGKERFRHVGFFGKEDIIAKWKELGVDLK
jgi:thioredoxin 1